MLAPLYTLLLQGAVLELAGNGISNAIEFGSTIPLDPSKIVTGPNGTLSIQAADVMLNTSTTGVTSLSTLIQEHHSMKADLEVYATSHIPTFLPIPHLVSP